MVFCSRLLLTFSVCLLLLNNTTQGQPADLTAAEQLLLRGKYAESEAAFLKLQKLLPIQSTLGLARGCWQQGQHRQAIEHLEQQIKQQPESKILHSQRAWIALQLGTLETCHQHLRLAGDNIQSRWVQAELFRLEGKIEEACAAYQKLADFYDNQNHQLLSAHDLFWLGQALAQHARFNSDTKRFRELTGKLYPRLLQLEPNFWQAHHQTGLLLLEKFNTADAEAAFQEGLNINPQAADLQAGLARLALADFKLDRARQQLDRSQKVNPRHAGALLCRADMEFASLRPAAAFDAVTLAQEVNAHSPKTLGRVAAAHELLTTSTEPQHQDALQKLVVQTDAKLLNTGEFYAAWGEALGQARRYPQAGSKLRKALKKMPQLLGPRGQLGMIEMRLGHEAIARQLLDESFQRDPFNVRVKNQLEVLDLLESYATKETKHFLIRYDATRDEPLAQAAARHAEKCYEELTAEFGYELPEKAVIEFFSDGRGVPARQWFGARMVGLPNIHTIAACSGNVVAMVSPTAEKRRLNWADILRHEIVHLVNLQQTSYAVPHWLTEGCAVWQEKRPRRIEWEKLLVSRVPRGEVFDLSTINMGFLRPRTGADWQMAYCQAEIYVKLIAKNHGTSGLQRLLQAYRDNLPADQAFQSALNTTIEDIEAAYAEQLRQIVSRLAKRSELQHPIELKDAEQRWKTAPTDLGAAAKLALVRLRQGDYPGAGRLADKILAKQPNQPLANLVKAQLLVRIGSEQKAAELLTPLTENNSADSGAIKLLAGLRLRDGNLKEAQRLYQQGAERQPDNLQWTKALAVVAIREQNIPELKQLLERIANAEPKNLVARKKLLDLANHDQDKQAARHWATEVLHVDPNDRIAKQLLMQFEEKKEKLEE